MLGFSSGSTWIVIITSSTASRSLASIRHQMACAASTLINPGTTEVKIDKGHLAGLPCADVMGFDGALGIATITSQISFCVSGGTATSISPPTLSRITPQPDHRILSATSLREWNRGAQSRW